MTDREERQHVIEELQNMVDWMEVINYIVATPERIHALGYAIASIKTDLKYDLLYEETSGQADKRTTKKDCNTCTHSNETDGSNCYECIKDMCNNYEPTTKNDHHKQNIQAYAHDFSVSEEQAKKELRVTTKNDLGVDWENYKDVDGNSLDDLILEVLQNNFDCGNTYGYKVADEIIGLLPSVTPQEPRKGEWLRMSDLSEQEDYRYKCSRCGNVIKHKSKMDLYTFNSWCGRCGSDNGRKIEVEG